ncbi:hypothetical protein BRARA_A03471 [Brassica rapa]|uniref:Uncharacterized protein n=1 Tax=Brassica campestris TaxID=3711 RepID=A0A398AZB2_BRACM|nr:hypothetical protein BRARA_A03471 [Brassica rapa]
MAGGGKHTLTPKTIIHQKFGVFKMKNDSEQSAAELDLKKFLPAEHPLGAHFRATLRRDVVLKLSNPSVESDPFLVISCVMKTAAKLSDFIVASPHELVDSSDRYYLDSIAERLSLKDGSQVMISSVWSIKESSSSTLVDFGCGSGSLL